jgi:membrane-associated HD superfamily phosphohydrolase
MRNTFKMVERSSSGTYAARSVICVCMGVCVCARLWVCVYKTHSKRQIKYQHKIVCMLCTINVQFALQAPGTSRLTIASAPLQGAEDAGALVTE